MDAERFRKSFEEPPSSAKLVGKRLIDFERPEENGPDELLKRRFLSRGGGLLLVGPTGVGKSSLAMQLSLLWSIGKPAFDIRPARPLRILIIQAENDDGDIAEARDGVLAGLTFSESQRRAACENIIVYNESGRAGPSFFVETLEPLIVESTPDLIFIDPALAYLGGETNSQRDVGAFLRQGLDPLLKRYKIGAIVIHHTNKPPSGKEKRSWENEELAYLGSGSAEWVNWARASIALRASGVRDELGRTIFELTLTKRGANVGWRTADGAVSFAKLIAHSREAGQICWYEVAPEQIVAAPIRSSPEALLEAVPEIGSIQTSELIKLRPKSMGIQRARALVDELIAKGTLVQSSVARPKKRPEVHVARSS